jgi:hypothetical protein
MQTTLLGKIVTPHPDNLYAWFRDKALEGGRFVFEGLTIDKLACNRAEIVAVYEKPKEENGKPSVALRFLIQALDGPMKGRLRGIWATDVVVVDAPPKAAPAEPPAQSWWARWTIFG